MEFAVSKGAEYPSWTIWNDSFSTDIVFMEFFQKQPQLRQLMLSQKDAHALKKKAMTTPISLVKPGMTVYVDLRSWSPLWYDGLSLPNKHFLTYVTRCVYGKYCGPVGKRKYKIKSSYPDMCNEVFEVDNWFVTTYGHQKYVQRKILINVKMVKKFNLGPRQRNRKQH
jgi:hypothetical protein